MSAEGNKSYETNGGNTMNNEMILEAGKAAGLKGVEFRRAEVYMELGYELDQALNLSRRYCPSSTLYQLDDGEIVNTRELAQRAGISESKVKSLDKRGISATDIINGRY